MHRLTLAVEKEQFLPSPELSVAPPFQKSLGSGGGYWVGRQAGISQNISAVKHRLRETGWPAALPPPPSIPFHSTTTTPLRLFHFYYLCVPPNSFSLSLFELWLSPPSRVIRRERKKERKTFPTVGRAA